MTDTAPPPGPSEYEPAVPSAPPHAFEPPLPPPAWPETAPVKKSRRNLWIALAVILGLIVVGIGSCAVWFVGTVKAPVDASNQFLAAIDDGDYAEAIALSDSGCSRGMSEADLETVAQGADITYNLNSSSITNSSSAKYSTATVSGSFSIVGQDWTSITLLLQDIDGWKVCGFNAE